MNQPPVRPKNGRPSAADQRALAARARRWLRAHGVLSRRAGYLPSPEPCANCRRLVTYFRGKRLCGACYSWEENHHGQPRPVGQPIRIGRPRRPVGRCAACPIEGPLILGQWCPACYERQWYQRRKAGQAG